MGEHVARPLQHLINHLRQTGGGEAEAIADAELLKRYVRGRDEAAFELLVWRHGGLVLGTAHRQLGNAADAEDAFQAAFLTLARKAASIRHGACLAGWLHQVTCRIAVRLRRQQQARLRPLDGHDVVAPESPLPDDVAAVLDEEIARLPERFRRAVVLCYLEGRTAEEAGVILGCPRGTVLSRLANARRRLRPRLERRGVALAAAVAVPSLSSELVAATVPLSLRAVAPAQILTLSNGVIRAMFWNKLRAPVALTLLAALGLLAAGISRADKPPKSSPPDPLPAAKPVGSDTDKLRSLLEQRRDNLRELLQMGKARRDIEAGYGPLMLLTSTQQELLEVELELCRTPQERIDTFERALKGAREVYKLFKERSEVGAGPRIDANRARDAVLKIEVALQKEKMKQRK